MYTQIIPQNNQQAVFFTLVSTERQKNGASLLVDSLRSFGGSLNQCPVWIFTADSQLILDDTLVADRVQIIPLHTPANIEGYWFAPKVAACAQAEELAAGKVVSLIWLSTDCLIVKPPLSFDLGSTFDIALRPVHIRNIGLLAAEPLDDFWKVIYKTLGVQEIQTKVKSFVDDQLLRPYFNSHALSINPSIRLFRRWFELFERLVNDNSFQSGPCQDELHRIFLHQAVLSTLVASSVTPDRMRILPVDYSYPYNLHAKVPEERQARALNDLVCFAYEDRSLDPITVDDIEIHEPLKSWLSSRVRRLEERT